MGYGTFPRVAGVIVLRWVNSLPTEFFSPRSGGYREVWVSWFSTFGFSPRSGGYRSNKGALQQQELLFPA